MKKPPFRLLFVLLFLCKISSAQPGNNNCANAYLLSTGASCQSAQGTVRNATTTAGLTACASTTADDDVWFRFVATSANPNINLTAIGSNLRGASGGGAVVQLFSGTCGSFTPVNGIGCATNTNTTLTLATSGLTIGTTYYIRVYSRNATALTTNCNFDICVVNGTSPVADSTTALFNIDTVASNLGYPWEITYGPDDSLWITEARGYRVMRISSNRTGSMENIPAQQLLRIPLNAGEINFDGSSGRWPQGGMQGLAVHPELRTNSAKRWVYLAYVYKRENCPTGTDGTHPNGFTCIFRTKIIRCRFYYAADAGNPTSIPKRDTLVIMDTVISNLPGSNDHNSGRLKIGPVTEGAESRYKLYYTIGDMGSGQFNNDQRVNYALDKDTCEGKVLRLNTEEDNDVASFGINHDYNIWRRWIPNDNPFTHSVNGLRTPVYSYGHRNAQGLAWGFVNGSWRLYSSEHGDMSDDELNIIKQGRNYGWPRVTGLVDNNYTTSDDASDGFMRNNILAAQTITDESTWAAANPDFEAPVFTFFNWTNAQIETTTSTIYTWPTIAPSSIEFYDGGIPGWKNSLLVTSLKYGMFRLKLQATGDRIDSTTSSIAVDTFPLLHGWRVRDVAVKPSPNGGKMWVVMDNTGNTSGPTGGFDGSGSSNNTKSGGKVLMLSYKGLLTLPVKFISFNGKLMPDKTVRLEWKAETDFQHDYFEVEKSAINGSFVSIGRVTAMRSPYSFIDPSPFTGNNYYRIRQADKDGKITYSKVINVIYDPSKFMMTVYPNPFKDVLSIKVTAAKPEYVQVQVNDMQGRIIYNQSRFVTTSSVNDIQVDTRSWSSQLYSVKIISSDNVVLASEKVIKQ